MCIAFFLYYEWIYGLGKGGGLRDTGGKERDQSRFPYRAWRSDGVWELFNYTTVS